MRHGLMGPERETLKGNWGADAPSRRDARYRDEAIRGTVNGGPLAAC